MQIKIQENDANQRIDKFLRKYLKRATLGFIYKLIRTKVRVNNKKVKQDYRLKYGDNLDLNVDEYLTKKDTDKITRITFKILYEDPYYLIIDKPAGIASHSGTGNKENTLMDQILSYLQERSLSFRPALANRLDKDTSGIVIVGKTAEALRLINKELHERRITKFYLAIVKGRLEKAGKIETYIERERLHGQVKAKIVKEKTKDAKIAVTYYKPFKQIDKFTLLVMELDTGRTHQIRAHLASIGHPILGDNTYGDIELNKKLKLKRHFLHAYRISFVHPMTKNKIEIEAKLPEDLKEVMRRLGEDIYKEPVKSILAENWSKKSRFGFLGKKSIK